MHMRQMLREAPSRRTVGLMDAVNDLGTHRIHGCEVPYSKQMVYLLLSGKSQSEKLLTRVIEFRPDLLGLSWVNKDVVKRARKMGWSPRQKRDQEKAEGISRA